MNIVYTRHAKNRMRWRKITPEEVEGTINNFDRKEYINPEKFNLTKFHLFKAIGNRLIRVTAVEQENNLIVLAVVDKKD